MKIQGSLYRSKKLRIKRAIVAGATIALVLIVLITLMDVL